VTDAWDAHYADGNTFSPLRDAERALLAEHAPAPDGGGHALDVGCGLGELARHLAELGYEVDAVDFAPAALTHARAQNAATAATAAVNYHLLDIERDSLDALPHPAYDLITFRLSWAFVHDRTRVMNRLRERLRPGGVVCVITPVAADVPDGKRSIALDDEEFGALCAGWARAERYDADGLAFVVLRDPAPAPSTFTGKKRPSPHALTGAGVVVTDEAGRILLGWSVRGVWELPGGKNDADEGFLAAGVRELAEETGLKADPGGARLLALLMDSTHGIPRLTGAVRVTAWTGQPAVTEPQLIHRWEWHEVADLPALSQPLFTPSAQVIDTVWPGLLSDLPPVHRYPITPAATPEPAQQAAEAAKLREAMADRLVADGWVDAGGAIDAAFRRVPRHRFLPGTALPDAYDTHQAPVTKRTPGATVTSSVSAPWVQAAMLRDAALRPGDTVLEIGSGGYNAALVQEVVGPHGSVTSIDIDPYVTDRARRFLDDTGHHRVRVHLGDGEHAPAQLAAPDSVDAVLVTVEARDLPPSWTAQLADGGRLVAPLRVHGYTWSIPFTKRAGLLTADTYTVCGFVPLQGPGHREDAITRLRGGEVTVRFADSTPADTSRLEDALAMPRVEHWTGITIPGETPFDMLLLWLATHLDGFARLAVLADHDPNIRTTPGGWDAAAVVRNDSLARLLTRKLSEDGTPLWEFGIHAYGPHADDLARTMASQVIAWDREARGTITPRLTVSSAQEAAPTAPTAPDEDPAVITKQHVRLTFDWSAAFSPRDHGGRAGQDS
jgi:protein-L-isoaspartate(D-aspartate) O-methyltransferase